MALLLHDTGILRDSQTSSSVMNYSVSQFPTRAGTSIFV